MKRKQDGIDVGGKSPCFQYYPADYERDVQILSLAAQGLWSRMLGWMHFCARRGYLELPTGEPMTHEDIAARVGRPLREVSSALAEMERIGLFSRDARGCIYCRRMSKDTRISEARRHAAEVRMQAAQRDEEGRFMEVPVPNPKQDAGDFAPAKRPAVSQQLTVPSYSLSSSSSYSSSDSVVDCVQDDEATNQPTNNKRLVDIAQLLTDFMGSPPDDGIVQRVSRGLGGAPQEELRFFLLQRDPVPFQRKRPSPWAYLAASIETEFSSIARRHVITDAVKIA
jgi:hypothetical protein